MPNAKVQFIEWLKVNQPDLYNVAVKTHALKNGQMAIHGITDFQPLGAIDFGSFFSTVTDVVGKIAPSVIAARSQRDIVKIQLERAKQGLPPMNTSDFAPVVKVQTDITRDNEDALTRIATSTADNTLQKYGVYIAGGLVALLFFMRKKGRR
jgi:hypothetical protein